MARILRIFLEAEGRTKWTVLLCLILSNLAGGIGLMTLLPALTIVLDDPSAQPSLVDRIVTQALDALGLPVNLEVLLGVILAGALLKSALIVFSMIYVGWVVADVTTDLRTRLMRALLAARWAYFTARPLGRFANAMSIDVWRSAQTYLLAMTIVASMLEGVVSIGLAFLITWRLAVLGVVIGAVIVVVFGPLIRVSKKVGRRQQQRTAALVTLMSDALAGIKPLKAMARQHTFLRLFERHARELRKALRRQTVAKQVMSEAQEPVYMVFALISLYVAHVHLGVPASELVVMALLLKRTVNAIGRVQRQLQQAVVQEASHRAVARMMAEAGEAEERFDGTQRPTLEEGCAFERVFFAFGDKMVLENLSMTIPARALTVIKGPSGVGKTTLTDLLLGLYEPTGGRVLIDGVPLAELDLAAWRRMVGYVPQELVLFNDTVLANVTLGDPEIDAAAAVEALKTAGAWDFVAALPDGIQSRVGERGSQLSGGQRQRIALARALVTGPELLICDEVTSALDPQTEAAIIDNIRALGGRLTILSITHRPAWLDVADRVYELRPHGTEVLAPASARRLAVVPSGEGIA